MGKIEQHKVRSPIWVYIKIPQTTSEKKYDLICGV